MLPTLCRFYIPIVLNRPSTAAWATPVELTTYFYGGFYDFDNIDITFLTMKQQYHNLKLFHDISTFTFGLYAVE